MSGTIRPLRRWRRFVVGILFTLLVIAMLIFTFNYIDHSLVPGLGLSLALLTDIVKSRYRGPCSTGGEVRWKVLHGACSRTRER